MRSVQWIMKQVLRHGLVFETLIFVILCWEDIYRLNINDNVTDIATFYLRINYFFR